MPEREPRESGTARPTQDGRKDGGKGNTPTTRPAGVRDGSRRPKNGGRGDGPNINRHEMASNYGFALAFLNSDPDLKKLFNQAVRETWTAEKFIAQLRGTKWFKKHSASVRNAILQQKSDPATYQQRVGQMVSTVRDLWGRTFGDTMSDKQIHRWAETAYRMGWSEAQLLDHMTQGINYRKMLRNQSLGGTAAETATKLSQVAQQYGLQVGNQWTARQVERIIEGDDTFEGAASRLKDWAKQEYRAFADQIDGGATIQDIAEPYVQRMAQLLELNPADVDVFDKQVQTALKMQSKDGKPAAMDLGAFADMVRKDPRWEFTDNAREQVNSVTSNLLRSFGLQA